MSVFFQRVKAVISYDGSKYFGFQKQTSTPYTVTNEIEKALESLQIKSQITGSGRTDARVHASGQVIHFDIPQYWQDLKNLTYILNKKLNHIHFKHISKTAPDFHARFHAKRRIYRYIFKTQKPSVFEYNYVSWYYEFNTDMLIKALKIFEGEHSFEMFKKTGSKTYTNIRKIYRTHYFKYGIYHLVYFEANGYLRAQVRMMIDAAMLCAAGRLTIGQLQEQLYGHHRYTTGIAPAHGLYLARIIY